MNIFKAMEEQDVRMIVEQAMIGNWIPFGVILCCFGIVVWMFIYILKEKEKGMLEKHCNTDKILQAIVKNQQTTEVLLERVTVRMEQHDSDLKDLKNHKA